MSEPEKQTHPLSDTEAVERLAKARAVLVREIHKVIIGQEQVIDEMLITLFCRGHCLVIGVPGLAKTQIGRASCRERV